MGNRCVITAKCEEMNEKIADSCQTGIYLHWNGGRNSVQPFLDYCQMLGIRSFDEDNYGYARFCQVVANFFGNNGLSIGVDNCKNLDCDNFNNGVYFVENWEIVGRAFFSGEEEKENDYLRMLEEIDQAQAIPLGKTELKKRIAELSEARAKAKEGKN